MDPCFKKIWIESSGYSESAVIVAVQRELEIRYNEQGLTSFIS